MSLFLSNSRELVIVLVIIVLNNLNPRQRGHYEGCSVDGVVGVDVGFNLSATCSLAGRVNY